MVETLMRYVQGRGARLLRPVARLAGRRQAGLTLQQHPILVQGRKLLRLATAL